MPTSAKGIVQLSLENANNPGPQTGIVGFKTIAATMSADNQPRATSMGQRLLIKIYNAGASGSMTIAGTDILGNAVSETISNIPATAPSQQANVNWFEYVTTHAYATINSSGITTTGLTGGTLIIDAIQSGKYLFPTILKAKTHYDTYSPDESRGLLDRDTRLIQLIKNVSIDSIDQILYPNESLWLPYAISNQTPTITTNPATPTVLQASTALTTLTPSSQPNFPGQKLIFVISSSSSVGSFTVSGVNQYGVSVTETITCGINGASNGNGTYYSTHCYSAINTNGIAGVTGLSSANITITAVYNWIYAFVPGDSIYSLALEWFVGSESYTFPWTLIQEASLEYDPKKGIMIGAKGIAQNQLAIGSRSSNLTTSNLTLQSMPTGGDIPMGGWQTNCYIDALGTNLLNGFYGDIISGKITFKTPVEGGYTITNTQLYNRQLRGRREVEVDLTVDLANGLQLEQFRSNALQFFSVQSYGTTYGNGQGAQWTITVPFYYQDAEVQSVPADNRAKAAYKFKGVYDAGLGGSFIITVQSQMPPIYPA